MPTVTTLGAPLATTLHVAAAFGTAGGPIMTVCYSDGTVLKRQGAGDDWEELPPAPLTSRATILDFYVYQG